jgi:hypothetical protein
MTPEEVYDEVCKLRAEIREKELKASEERLAKMDKHTTVIVAFVWGVMFALVLVAVFTHH